MDNSRLQELLGRYKASVTPTPPANLRQNVWREIRLRQSASVSLTICSSEFLAWFRRNLGHLVAPALAVAVMMSVSMTLASNQQTSRYHTQQALGLQVFSHQSSPLARLAANP